MRVSIRPPSGADVEMYRDAVSRSLEHLRPWSPSEPDDLAERLQRQSATHQTRLVIAETGGLVGMVNLQNIVRSRFQNAALGYESYLPHAGKGLMTAGLRLVVAEAFSPEPDGLGLHRLEINVRPENEPSVAMARRLGFRHEGLSPRMLFLDGAWRDHERFALTADEVQR